MNWPLGLTQPFIPPGDAAATTSVTEGPSSRRGQELSPPHEEEEDDNLEEVQEDIEVSIHPEEDEDEFSGEEGEYSEPEHSGSSQQPVLRSSSPPRTSSTSTEGYIRTKPPSGDHPDSEETLDSSYRETMRALRNFMKWRDIPEHDSSSGSPEDDPWDDAPPSTSSRLSVKVPVERFLCKRLENLNLTAREGYPQRTAESTPLTRDQFIRTPAHQKWYAFHAPTAEFDPAKVSSWSPELAKLNAAYHRISRASAPTNPSSRPISQETARKWEKLTREQSVMANQAAAINRGLRCVQARMTDQLKFLKSHRDSLPDPVKKALGDVENLCVFNKRLSTAMSRTMKDLSEGSFLMMSNFTLLRRDSFLDYIRPGVKTDTLQDLRCGPFHMDTLFSDLALAQAEKEMTQFEDRRPQGEKPRSQ